VSASEPALLPALACAAHASERPAGEAAAPRSGAPNGEENVRAQMEIYALELRRALELSRTGAEQLGPALEQLRIYAADLHELREAHERISRSLEGSCVSTLRWLVDAVDRRDGESQGHSQRVARYTRLLGESLGLSARECEHLEIAGRLHDAGRVEWPDTILLKRGPLSAEERQAIEVHCELASALAGTSSAQLTTIAEVIAHHHEHWDGSGYPHGLSGEAIPLSARIVQLADVYDTLRTAYRYKSTQSHVAACRAILQGDRRVSPAHFDPTLLDAFGQAAARLADPELESP
jgi:response regulator RpfG family c-di-GMP phosphodiesterase